MAFGSRNSLLTIFSVIGAALGVFFGVNAVLALFPPPPAASVNFFSSHPFWFVYDLSLYGGVSSVIGMILLVLGGFFAFQFYRIFFKRVGQAEIFFFSLFFFSLLPESLRLAVLNLQVLNGPSFLSIILSRIVYGSRVFGLLCFFVCGLYALDLQYQKFAVLTVVIAAAAFFLGLSIPFDSQILLTDGLFKLSDEQGLFIIYLSLFLLVIVNYAVAVFRGRGPVIPLGVFCLLLGREALFFPLQPLLLAAGAVVFSCGFYLTYRGYKTHFDLV